MMCRSAAHETSLAPAPLASRSGHPIAKATTPWFVGAVVASVWQSGEGRLAGSDARDEVADDPLRRCDGLQTVSPAVHIARKLYSL